MKAAATLVGLCCLACVAGDTSLSAGRGIHGRTGASSGFVATPSHRLGPAPSLRAHARHSGTTTSCSAEGPSEKRSGGSASPRRALLQGLAAGAAALGLSGAASAAAPNLDPRNAAGVGLSKDAANAAKGPFQDAKGPFEGAGPGDSADGRGMPKQKPKAGSAAANLQIFQDDILGYAFAMPPNWRGESRQLDSGGQILAFVDDKNQGKTSAIVTVVAQPTKLDKFEELEQAIVPRGNMQSKKVANKDASHSDGSVVIYETKDVNKAGTSVRVQALFCLRIKPETGGNWIVSMTAQADEDLYPSYVDEFKGIVKSFRPTYPKPAGPKRLRDSPANTEISDDELGVPVKGGDSKLDDTIKNMPFGGL